MRLSKPYSKTASSPPAWYYEPNEKSAIHRPCGGHSGFHGSRTHLADLAIVIARVPAIFSGNQLLRHDLAPPFRTPEFDRSYLGKELQKRIARLEQKKSILKNAATSFARVTTDSKHKLPVKVGLDQAYCNKFIK
jgi:hypothetical protein